MAVRTTPSKAELVERLAKMEALVSRLSGEEVVDYSEKVEQLEERVDPSEKPLQANDYIKVLCLCTIPLNLSTEKNGKGIPYTFKRYGQIKSIIYSDLVKIFESYYKFLEDGLFYILDSRVVRQHGFDEIYSHILTKEKLDVVFQAASKEAVEIFRTASEAQREFIVDYLVGQVRDDAPIDLNILDQISRLIDKKDADGNEFNIKKAGEDSKKYVKA